MTENTKDTIQRLLREGLDLYGVDEVTAAIMTWQKVLELDPENVEAHDYLRTADRRRLPRGDAAAGAGPAGKGAGGPARSVVIPEARLLLRRGDFAGAVDLLEGVSGPDTGDLEYQAILDLARGRLYADYCERVGDLGRVPRVRGDAGELTQFNLPANAGFVLSMVDGHTCLEDLIALSGMDAFEALHTLCGMLDAGIVEMAE